MSHLFGRWMLRVRGLIFVVTIITVISDTISPTGQAGCKCIEWAGLDGYVVDGSLIYRPSGSSSYYNYPSNYGNMECKAHDQNLPPFCQSSPPAWCAQKWCYVNKAQCTGSGIQTYRSSLFSDGNVYYSYETCGASNQFQAWFAQNAETSGTFAGESVSVVNLIDVLQQYLWSTRAMMEEEYIKLNAAPNLQGCQYSKMCNCLECYQNQVWNTRTDFSDVGSWIRSEPGNLNPARQNNLTSCLSKGIRQTYIRVAAKEGQPQQRVGYQYFADQLTGSYVGWPNAEWCPTQDLRFRPWYAAGSTGPKDVVIVVDVSGSMGTAGRNRMAKEATAAVLDTLEWKDYATIILFNSGISAEYSSKLRAMTPGTRNSMKAWLENQNFNSGGTNFKTALNRAFDIIGSSVSAGETSMCQKAILFLTDGEAEFSENDFTSTRQLSVRYDTTVFTYALGSGAQKVITKRLACENRGIFYAVPDGGDLTHVMSKYYAYFAAGQQVCNPSFTSYADAVTGKTLWPSCLPLYNRASSTASLLGVTCMDMNVLVDPEVLKQRSDWQNLTCKISDMTKKCQAMEMSECTREKLRKEYSTESMCESTTSAATQRCPCTDPSCQDDDDFIDEKGYFCDTWIGDNCDTADVDWQYSAGGKAAVLLKCKRSCNKCTMRDPCPVSTAPSCSVISQPSASTCRACRTNRVSGVDIEGSKMRCPGSTPSPDVQDSSFCMHVNLCFASILILLFA